MGELQNKIRALWLAERARWILWVPVLLGLGIGWYFSLASEPPLWPLAATTAALLALAALSRGKRHAVTAMAFAAALVALGMGVAAWRTLQVAAPVLQEQLWPQQVTGTVAEITHRPDSTRLTLRDVRIEHLAPEETPYLVTVSLRGTIRTGVGLGDAIRIRAGFFPPPKPVFPGSYAFNRHFYFQRIGATGYAVGKTQPEIVLKAQEADGFMGWLAQERLAIAAWLMEKMGPREGAVAAALMVGEQRAIPDDIYESMRQSGLVHILSISGMHLTLAAGIFFFAVRMLLACIAPLALRYDGKKLAAFIALLGTLAYLLLAGAPIPAQRSFVMVALVLGAVMLSRKVTPIRSLALAALLILLFAPESLLNPGFQLSFAATLAILAYYEHWMERRESVPPEEWTWKQRQARFWGGVLATSVVATLATTPYILHHFEGLPVYSVLANLAVTPLASFWIMPLVVLVLVTLPFGLAGVFLPALKWGIAAMLLTAEKIHHAPYAVIDLPPLPVEALVVITLGGLWLCLWQMRWRWLGLAPIVLGLCSLAFYQPPQMVISADGKKIALRTTPEQVVMLRGQRSGFMQDGWRRFLRSPAFDLRRKAAEEALRCDDTGCIYRQNGTEVAFSRHRSTLAEDCRLSDMVITPEWSSYRDTRGICKGTRLFDRAWLAKVQGAAFWLDGEEVRIRTVRETLGNRPWSGAD